MNPSRTQGTRIGVGQDDLQQSPPARVPHGSLGLLAWLGWLAGLAKLRGAGEHGTTSYPCSLNREPACLSGYSCCASGLQHLETSLLCASETVLLLARDTQRRHHTPRHPKRHQLAGSLLSSEHLRACSLEQIKST